MLKEVRWSEDRSYRTGSESEPVQFYMDGLCHSKNFDLLLGYFSSAAINVLSLGFATFLRTRWNTGGTDTNGTLVDTSSNQGKVSSYCGTFLAGGNAVVVVVNEAITVQAGKAGALCQQQIVVLSGNAATKQNMQWQNIYNSSSWRQLKRKNR